MFQTPFLSLCKVYFTVRVGEERSNVATMDELIVISRPLFFIYLLIFFRAISVYAIYKFFHCLAECTTLSPSTIFLLILSSQVSLHACVLAPSISEWLTDAHHIFSPHLRTIVS